MALLVSGKLPSSYCTSSWLTGFVWLTLVIVPGSLLAQPVVDQGEHLSSDRPEAWAMAYMSAATLFSGFGVARSTEPWTFSLAGELGHIPRLSERKRRVGFDGTKLEDLNKSPVYGSARFHLALPADFGLELGWTPPVTIGGARPNRLAAIALERPFFEGNDWRGAARIFHQRGRVTGDFTCDRETASHPPGSPGNPFGCRAASRDRFTLNQTGLELSVAHQLPGTALEPYLAYTATYMRPRTRVQAETFGVLDRSLLTTSMTTHTVTIGMKYDVGGRWSLLGALAWTPLDARRPPDGQRSTHDLWSVRAMLRRRF
jgi:hypothetical protein